MLQNKTTPDAAAAALTTLMHAHLIFVTLIREGVSHA